MQQPSSVQCKTVLLGLYYYRKVQSPTTTITTLANLKCLSQVPTIRPSSYPPVLRLGDSPGTWISVDLPLFNLECLSQVPTIRPSSYHPVLRLCDSPGIWNSVDLLLANLECLSQVPTI